MLRQAQRPALPLEKTDIDTVLAASDLDWSETDPSILGTCSSAGSTLASARSSARTTPTATRSCCWSSRS